MSTNKWKNLSEIRVDVFIHGCEVPRIAGVGVAAVEKDECRLWVRLDDRLHVGRRGQREGDVRVTETSMELDCMKDPPRSDVV